MTDLRRFSLCLAAGVCASALAACSAEAPQASDTPTAEENAQPQTAAQTSVPDLSGWWQHNVSHLEDPEEGEGPVSHYPGMRHLYGADRGQGLPGTDLWVGNYEDPLLQPWAAETVKARGDKEQEMGQSDWQLLQLCMLVGTPHILLLRDPVEILQAPDQVTFFYHRDQQVRHVYMNAQHPEHIEPSPYGHSIGWYEDDALVVDTVGQTVVGPIDYYGTPHTEQIHVVERYRMIEDGAALETRVTVDDPGTFTAPWTGVQRYDRSRRTEWEEIRCAENPKDIDGGEYPIPTDETPDF